MKKNNIRTITALTALLALAACGDRLQTSEPVELRFTSGLQMQTRAAYVSTQNTQIVSGEKVYAWVDEAVPSPGTPVEYVHAWELTAGLLAQGFSEAEVEGVLGQNLLNFLEKTIG